MGTESDDPNHHIDLRQVKEVTEEIGTALRRNPDISKAKRELDWEPSITLEDGLSRTIAYYKAIK